MFNPILNMFQAVVDDVLDGERSIPQVWHAGESSLAIEYPIGDYSQSV